MRIVVLCATTALVLCATAGVANGCRGGHYSRARETHRYAFRQTSPWRNANLVSLSKSDAAIRQNTAQEPMPDPARPGSCSIPEH